MSRFEFKLPDIGEGVTEGEIVQWHVQAGVTVKEDQPMVEVMTDKATVTIGAPKAGTILETRCGVGQILPVGSVLVVIETVGKGDAPVEAPPAAQAAPVETKTVKSEGPAATAVGDIKESVAGGSLLNGSQAKGSQKEGLQKNGSSLSVAGPNIATASNGNMGVPGYWEEKPLASPATRKLARDLGIDLRSVSPSGDGGRVTQDDVHRALSPAVSSAPQASNGSQQELASRAVQPTSTSAGISQARAPISIPSNSPREEALEERKPFVGIRRKIAERMQTSKNTAAHFTFVEECDVGRLKELRARMQPLAKEQGVKLSFLPFIVKAVVAALKKHPVLNTALDESTNELVYRKYIHMGIAASTDQGLMVPVVKDADRRSLLDLAKEIDRLGTGAKAGTLASSDLSGSTFTVTSLGTQGGLFATPILNHPEVGILGVHQMKQKPVVRDGQIVVGEVMLLSLSFDHRIVDGHVGAAFAYDIIGFLENPDRLFLEV